MAKNEELYFAVYKGGSGDTICITLNNNRQVWIQTFDHYWLVRWRQEYRRVDFLRELYDLIDRLETDEEI